MTFRGQPFALPQTRRHVQVFFQNRTVIKDSSMRWRKTHPTVQHKSNCAGCFLCYRITCWWDDGSLSLNTAITIGCMIPGSALWVNNIIVILGTMINYDYEIMIINSSIAHLGDCVASLIHFIWWEKTGKFKNSDIKNKEYVKKIYE